MTQMGNRNLLGSDLSDFGCVPDQGAHPRLKYRPIARIHGCPPKDRAPVICDYPDCFAMPLGCGDNAADPWAWSRDSPGCSAGHFCDWSRGWRDKFYCSGGVCYPNPPGMDCQQAAYRRTYPGGSRDLNTPTNIRALPIRPVHYPGEPYSNKPWNPIRRIVCRPMPVPGFDATRYAGDRPPTLATPSHVQDCA